jgi:hypothetical protein
MELSTSVCLASIVAFIISVVFFSLKPLDSKGKLDTKKKSTFTTLGVVFLFLAIAGGAFGCHELYRSSGFNITSLLASSF